MAGVYVSGTGRGGCRKPALYPLSLEASSLPISQLGNLDFYLDFSVESISQVAEDTLPTPPLGTSSVAADTALRLPAAQPPAHPFLSTSDTTAGTSPQLPAVLPPTPLFLSTSDITSGTSPQLPAVLPRGEIIDDSHKEDDVSISMGHLSEESMSWQDWENSFMAFKAFFDGGAKICEAITLGFHVDFPINLVRNLACAVFGVRAIHSMKLSHGSSEVKADADTLNIKQQELDSQRREVHAFSLAKCVTETTTRSSPRASFVLFGHSS
ncbi:hypothetical protein PRUPE_4G286200 [Prunus persica]|uniref:Uncharacterized protein n=1 Tax=Prunus persica TaxID=3760 RepID=A0A251PTY2_PRUPE|nr:uncharacterized protein LOC109948906 [Prunus persica]XP_020418357.1 uncharacterized protein LOC109948906 [Prunus persica]ONI14540.1 hypothetical protein PRUPE_4G286200 [Prunus persica]